MADPKRFPSGPYDVVLGILQLALIIGIVSLRSLDALEKSLAGGGFIPIASTSLDYQAQQVVVDVSGVGNSRFMLACMHRGLSAVTPRALRD
jgi:hypothetical protein